MVCGSVILPADVCADVDSAPRCRQPSTCMLRKPAQRKTSPSLWTSSLLSSFQTTKDLYLDGSVWACKSAHNGLRTQIGPELKESMHDPKQISRRPRHLDCGFNRLENHASLPHHRLAQHHAPAQRPSPETRSPLRPAHIPALSPTSARPDRPLERPVRGLERQVRPGHLGATRSSRALCRGRLRRDGAKAPERRR